MYARYCKLRDKKGLTDADVSRATNIPKSTLSDWKQRSLADPTAKLSVDHLYKIARLLNTSIENMIRGS